MRRREPESRLLPAGTGQATLVVVPSYAGDAVHGKSYADKLYASAALGAESSCGYVVDLRGNGGGNMWPMFAGIGDLLGRAPVISNITRDGNHAMYTSLGNAERLFGQPLLDWRPLPRLATLPVAVLIDDGVGSSGEAVAIAFHGRARTKFFGQRTYGLTTMNGQFQLADLKLHVTTGKMADRNGMDFPEGLEPDVQVPSVATSGTDEDPAIAAARAWLAQQPECGSVT
jgi:C-terminal processing protease CtpA/Prc